MATEFAFGGPTGLKLGWYLGNSDRLCALARSHLCMPSWRQDTVAVLTFQAEAVPVLAQGAHFLRCGEQGGTGLWGAKLSSRLPPSPPPPPSDPPCFLDTLGSVFIQNASSIRLKCYAPHRWKGGLGPHRRQLLTSSGNPTAHTDPIIFPSSARASPKKTGCWQRGQIQLMAPLRAVGAAHSRHSRGDSFPAPFAGSTHDSAFSTIGLNPLLLNAHWAARNLALLHLGDAGGFTITSKKLKPPKVERRESTEAGLGGEGSVKISGRAALVSGLVGKGKRSRVQML